MTGFGQNPTTGTQGALSSNQFPISSVAVPNHSAGDLTALKGGTESTDTNGNKLAAAATYTYDGENETLGAKANAAVTDATQTATEMSFIKGLVKILADIWDSVNHWLQVKVMNTVTVSGSVTTSGTVTEANSAAINTSTATSATQNTTTATNTGNTSTALGTPTQTKATDGSATAWSIIQLLKGIYDRFINGTIAVTGTFWQATQPVSGTFWQTTQPVSGTVTANAGSGNMGSNLTQVNGTTLSTTNPVPTNSVAQAGIVAAYGSNPAALTANTDAAFKWGAGGTTAVNHILIANNTTANINYELDAATNAGSDVLAPGQKIQLDVAGTLAAHVQANGTPNLNGSSASNIVVRGWL